MKILITDIKQPVPEASAVWFKWTTPTEGQFRVYLTLLSMLSEEL